MQGTEYCLPAGIESAVPVPNLSQLNPQQTRAKTMIDKTTSQEYLLPDGRDEMGHGGSRSAALEQSYYRTIGRTIASTHSAALLETFGLLAEALPSSGNRARAPHAISACGDNSMHHCPPLV